MMYSPSFQTCMSFVSVWNKSRYFEEYLYIYIYSFSWRFYPKRLTIANYVRARTPLEQLGVKGLAQGHICVSQFIRTWVSHTKGMCLVHCAITTPNQTINDSHWLPQYFFSYGSQWLYTVICLVSNICFLNIFFCVQQNKTQRGLKQLEGE